MRQTRRGEEGVRAGVATTLSSSGHGGLVGGRRR